MNIHKIVTSALLLYTCLLSGRTHSAIAFDIEEYTSRIIKEHYAPEEREIGFRLGRYVIDGVLRDQPAQVVKDTRYNEVAVRNFSLRSVEDRGLLIDYDLRWQQFEDIPLTNRRYKRAETNCDGSALIGFQASQGSEVVLNAPVLNAPDCTTSGFGVEQVLDYMSQGLTFLASGGEESYGLFDILAGFGTLGFNYVSAVNQTSTTLSDPVRAELFDDSHVKFIESIYKLDDDYNEVYLSDIRYDPDGVWFIFTYPQWLQEATDQISNGLSTSLGLTSTEQIAQSSVAQSFDGRFRAVNDWAGGNGYAGAFPNFHQADYNDGRGVVFGVIALNSGVARGIDVPMSELGNPTTPEERFRAVNDWAGRNGYAGAFPNFHQADYNDGRGVVFGVIALNSGAARGVDVPSSQLE